MGGEAEGKADNEFDVAIDNERAGIRIENISSPKLETRSGVRDQRMWVTEGLPNGNLHESCTEQEEETVYTIRSRRYPSQASSVVVDKSSADSAVTGEMAHESVG